MVARLHDALLPSREGLKSQSKVSIIIPVYNQVLHTLACLISLFESAPKACFEVIIADDCSTDETSTIFSKFSDRIRVIRTHGNLGFLKNCNHAAKAAKGEFVVFLNNDMVLLPDWLDSLVATISKDSECGMVGSKLLNLDGTLQEAGGIFWNDGSAWNYGRGQNPMAPEFNYKKEVDYCSGASICLRKEVWDSVGGFDVIYAPAYCEESDLAFRLRARGFKTIYQPRSVGIHLEGVSCGTDTTQGIKAYQVENQKKLMVRWSEVLKKEHFENGTNVFNARGKTKSKKSILFVDHYIPQHDRDAGSRTMLHIIERFIENGYNIIFWPENLHCDTKYAQHFQEMGVLVLYGHEFVTDFEVWFKANAQFLHGVFLSRPQVADNVINTIRDHSKLKVAFYGHDVHHLRLQRKIDIDPSDSTAIGEAKLLKEVENKIWGEVDVIYYPSQDEVDYVAKKSVVPISINKIRVLPPWAYHSFLSDVSANLSERAGLLFVAGFSHTPNIEGALWFAKKVWPLVLKKYPSAKLTLAGSNPVPEITALRSDSVKVTGYIPDSELEALYRSSRVSIAPLLHGAGVKGKVVEALKFGLPVVTTPTGAQGIPDSSQVIGIAESPDEMAQAILKLLKEDELWQKQSAASLQLIKNIYSTDAMWEPMKDLF
jgi:GT2 family glycosyltransferase/glycosyltransferase involved in cell wall biosynthesis